MGIVKEKKLRNAMENSLENCVVGNTVEEEKTIKSNGGEDVVFKGGNGRHVKQEDNSSKPNSPNRKDFAIIKEMPLLTTTERSSMKTNSRDSSIQNYREDQLKTAQDKMGEVREENERLKQLLAQNLKDYQSLQMQFMEVLRQEAAKKSTDGSPIHQETEGTELVSLSLGRTSSESNNHDEKKINGKILISNKKEREKLNEGLELGLDCRSFEPGSTEPLKKSSSENSYEVLKEEEPTVVWPPSKILKTMKSEDEEVLQETHLKKARVSVRARCDTPTMNDGCQWRKYGQKIAKGNPCPRAYYRCTVSPTCPVRKQVQRCATDMSILITTYEGTHNHPLPLSATAMASTTAAAASMLQSQSSTSQPGLGTSVSAPTSTSTAPSTLPGLNFAFSPNARPHQFYFPNSSISTCNSHPTITLDLTTPPNSSHFNRVSSAPRFSSSCLNFSSSSSSISLEPNTFNQTSWSSGHSNYPTFSSNLGRQQPQEHFYHQPYIMPMNNQSTNLSHQYLPETIAAASKVITSNPNFQSALAAAITSIVGKAGGSSSAAGGQQISQGRGESSGLNLKWGEPFPVIPTACPSTQNGIGCASSFLNKFPSNSNPQQQVGLSLFQHSVLPFSASESGSGSPVRNTREHIK